MKDRRKRRPGHSARQRAWVQSPRGRAAAKAAAEKSRIARLRKSRCGARKKGGGLCRNLPLANGRCKFHGGLSVGSDQWLKVQWPSDPVRLEKKKLEIARRRQRQRERVAEMTPEQRARWEAWHAARKPGPKSARLRAKQDREMAALLARPRQPAAPSFEVEALEAELAAIRAERERLQAIIATANLEKSQ